MSRHTQVSPAIVGSIAGGVFLFVFVVLKVLGGLSVSSAVFLALLVTLVALVALYRGFAGSASVLMSAERVAARPKASPAGSARAPEPTTDPAPAAAVEPAAAPEPAGKPSKPALLDGPAEGGADDLKKIKGVGPKMEAMLNGMGIFHFSQIASWGASEVAWVDDNLQGFKGRVSRDNWVEQAKMLASG